MCNKTATKDVQKSPSKKPTNNPFLYHFVFLPHTPYTNFHVDKESERERQQQKIVRDGKEKWQLQRMKIEREKGVNSIPTSSKRKI